MIYLLTTSAVKMTRQEVRNIQNQHRNREPHFLNTHMLGLLARIFCVVLIILGVILLVYVWEQGNSKSPDTQPEGTSTDLMGGASERITYNGETYVLKKKLESTLILGVDKASDFDAETESGYEQADLLLLLVVDRNANTYTLIHINRDTMAQIQWLTSLGAPVRTFTGQIALAHAYGGTDARACKNTVQAVSGLMNHITIHHYLSLSMDGVAVLNDLVGGVTVEVMDDINDTLRKGETVTLKGDQALTYVRARQGLEDATNLHRMERQDQYMTAFREAFLQKTKEDDAFALSTLLDVNEYLVSDCSVQQLSRLINDVSTFELVSSVTLEGEAKMGEKFIEFYPDPDALQQLIVDVFYTRLEG